MNFTQAYRAHFEHLLQTHPRDVAMALAVGNSDQYVSVGRAEADLLAAVGFRAGHSIVDLGCGSGRLSTELGQRFGSGIRYLGVDIMPEALTYAGERAPPDYRFELRDRPPIPADDGSADYVVAFSLFTHLLHEESFLYLRDAVRILAPRGRIVFSFLEAGRHWPAFERMAANPGGSFTIMIERPMIEVWAQKLGMRVRYDPGQFKQSVAMLTPRRRYLFG